MSTLNQIDMVSIIIPFWNIERFIPRLIEGLNSIHYTQTFEILLVDNNSCDSSVKLLNQAGYNNILLCPAPRSSYAARNVGLQAARGDIIAFTDADCKIDPNWLTEGVNHLIEHDCDMVSGRVIFEFQNQNSGWETFDAISHMNMAEAVKKGYAFTANLFVKKDLFNQLGNFAPVISGEDAEWTGKAVKSGYKLEYCDTAIVYHPTRSAKESIVKAYRVGLGFHNRKETLKGFFRDSNLRLFEQFIRGLLPPLLIKKRSKLKVFGYSTPVWKIYFPSWIASLSTSCGILGGFVKKICVFLFQ